MTRKHFEAIAAVFAAEHGGHDDSRLAEIAENLAHEFAKFNPHFDKERFLTACRGE